MSLKPVDRRFRAAVRGVALAALRGVALAALLAATPAAADDPFLRRTPTVEAVDRVGPAVVNITTQRVDRRRAAPRLDPFFDRFFRDFFEPRFREPSQSLGSGVLIDAERHVLTNEHVVAGAERIRVTLADGREFDAELVGADPNNDLAVLALATDASLPFVEPGSSGDLMVGEPVIAIGNPFGLSNTVTTGVVSAVNRSLRTNDRVYHGFLQTDASINPGNSGGPLLNAEGRLIGINTAIYGGGAQGIGFAIPIDVAKRIVRELIAKGEVVPVWLGLDLQDPTAELLDVLDLPPNVRGALVSRVRPDGPSQGTGLARGDVLVALDGAPIRSARDVYALLERSTVGQTQTLTFQRGDASKEVQVAPQEIGADPVLALAEQMSGLALAPEGDRYRVERVSPGSGAARAGFEPGDEVLAWAGHRVDDAGALRRAIVESRGRLRALVVVARAGRRYHVNVRLR